ncbi:MAG: U32 family peptidase C-terminal domain-containing protein, partial [Clostridia bacterium]|nr:U32 family peptidase C-terminal domain-containing protein [Clostridia bacterium]
AGNFTNDEIKTACEYAHSLGKKVYITINILAHEGDFDGLKEYLQELVDAKVDAVIVADLGIIEFINKYAPSLVIHVSTQANILNSYAMNFMYKMGVKRVVLAREVSIEEIKKIRQNIPEDLEIECFVHGAMCISYSGRCLLSNYLTGRDSNRGACVQACRWEYTITEKSRKGEQYEIQEDDRGTYILNSKDMMMIEHIKELRDAGVVSLKIEGRMKSPYYVANVVNSYRRAIDNLDNLTEQDLEMLKQELYKTSHRQYTTGFYFGAKDKECLESSMPVQTSEFMAIVVEDSDGEKVLIEQRNRFKVGDTLEILSPTDSFNKTILIEKMEDQKGEAILDAKDVQQKLYIYTNIKLEKGDILRK